MNDRLSPVVELVEVSTDWKNWTRQKCYFNIYGTREEMHNVPADEVREIHRRIGELLIKINPEGGAS
jgi:hypothetical protein